MKRHYIRITAVILILILVVMCLGAGFFTYAQIQKVNKDYMQTCLNISESSVVHFEETSDLTQVLKDTYSTIWRNAATIRPSDIGFSGKILWTQDGEEHFVTSGDYVRVYYQTDHPISSLEQIRILPVDDRFIAGEVHFQKLTDLRISADADDVFLYNGTMFYSLDEISGEQHYTFNLPGAGIGTVGKVDPNWASSYVLYGEYVKMAQSSAQENLDNEAQKICTEVIEDGKLTNTKQYKKEGLFTSYFVCYQATPYSITTPVSAYGAFTYHPLSIVMEKNAHVYILFGITLLFFWAAVIFVMYRMYITRKNYEMRSQQLTRSIAHELKTPLAVTKAYVENWEYIDEKERPQIAETLQGEVDHMTHLVNTLLDLSKLDSGNVTLKKEEVELSSLTRSILRRMDSLIKERDLHVTWERSAEEAATNGSSDDASEEEYLVIADLDLIKMAIGNFLSNAIKYADKKVYVKISGTGKNVRWEVRNDGKTISKKEQKQIWELFYKADKSRTERLGSSGIGLAVNRSILNLHGAKYGCNSDFSGTTFWFEMKRKNEQK